MSVTPRSRFLAALCVSLMTVPCMAGAALTAPPTSATGMPAGMEGHVRPSAASPDRDDALLLQCASEQGWRGLVDALERVSPPRTDDGRAAFERARLRIDATDPRKSSRERADAWAALDAAHQRRAAAALDAHARQQAAIEHASDALRIGLFANPATASACASADPEDTAAALALLRSVEDTTRAGARADGVTEADRALAFLHVAAQAMQVGVDRADRGGAASRDRRARAAMLLERLRTAREGIPPALSAVADLAECAAASGAGDPDSARAAAVRIVYLGEPLPAMFGRIFVCDALAESRMGDRALAELVQVIRVDGLSLPLRILAADAYVRLRDSLGKSSLAAPTFEAYGEVIRQSPAQERWSARLAVVERLGPITLRAVDTSWLPPEGIIARAHAQRIAGLAAAGDVLRAELGETSPDRVAMAAIAALDAAVRSSDAPLAADALKALATRFPDDPAWKGCAADLATLEIAIDAVHPNSRASELMASIVLAQALAADAPALRAVLPAQLAVEAIGAARAGTLTAADAAARRTALRNSHDGLDPVTLAGTRVLAATLVLDACSVDPAAASASAMPALPAGPFEMHPADAHLIGACLAERARDAAGSPAAAAAAARLKALASIVAATPHAARGAREVIAAWITADSGPDAKTARGLAAVLDAAAAIDPPALDALRLDVSLARLWGALSPGAAADRSARARAAAEHAHASREDLLALADALIDEAALVPPQEQSARLAEAMSVARLAETLDARGQPQGARGGRHIDWGARERMVRAARLAGRADEANAHIARLAALDPALGGNPGRFANR